MPKTKKTSKTSWGKVAEWYEATVDAPGSYHKDLLLPNLMRLVAPKKNEAVLDLACGSGFFAKAFAEHGARVTAVDVSSELIALAKKGAPANITFHVAHADKLPFLKDKSMDAITIVLAIQNIEYPESMLKECARVLKSTGKLFLVMNHPAFRIPKTSSWGWDVETQAQYRRIDEYLSESKADIIIHPGAQKSAKTISFHRPLQFYIKALAKNGFAVTRLEEWNSHKKSEPGPRAKAEDKARKEIPLFLFLECVSRL